MISLNIFDSTPTLNIIFLLLAVISVLFGIVSIYISRKSKIPIYNLKSFNLINSSKILLPDLQIQYSDKIITNLTFTKVSIWNIGKEIINNSDIAPLNPIRILTQNCNILSANIDFVKELSNNFKIAISENKKEVQITFDYFASDEGIVICIYHTGTSSENIKIDGKIKGVKKIENFSYLNDYHVGAVISSMLFRYFGGKSNKIWGLFLSVVLLPIWIIFLFLGQLFIKDSYRYKYVDRKFYLND